MGIQPNPFWHDEWRPQNQRKVYQIVEEKTFKKGLKAKSLEIFEAIGLTLILLNPAVSEIFYFKHDVGPLIETSVIIFIGNPDVDSLSVISDAIPVLT